MHYACMLFLYFIIIMDVHHLFQCTQPVANIVGKAFSSSTPKIQKNSKIFSNINKRKKKKKQRRKVIHHSDLPIMFKIPTSDVCLKSACRMVKIHIQIQSSRKTFFVTSFNPFTLDFLRARCIHFLIQQLSLPAYIYTV